MKPSDVFQQHRDVIRQMVLNAGMENPRLFGSALHGDDVEGSDLDILIDAPSGKSLFDVIGLQNALEDWLKIKVDVRLPGELHRKIRDRIVSEALSL